MRAIYTAPTLEAAEIALGDFDKQFGTRYPGAVDVWRNAWDDFIPFLDYPPELRRIVYTTNAIESINFQLRKITKNWGHFPDRDAAMNYSTSGCGISPVNAGVSPEREHGAGKWHSTHSPGSSQDAFPCDRIHLSVSHL
jgi:putative transposase